MNLNFNPPTPGNSTSPGLNNPKLTPGAKISEWVDIPARHGKQVKAALLKQPLSIAFNVGAATLFYDSGIINNKECEAHDDADRTLTTALNRSTQNYILRLLRLALESLEATTAAESARRKLATFKKSPGVSRLIAELSFHIGRGRHRQSDRTGALIALRHSLAFDPLRDQTHQAVRAALALPLQP